MPAPVAAAASPAGRRGPPRTLPGSGAATSAPPAATTTPRTTGAALTSHSLLPNLHRWTWHQDREKPPRGAGGVARAPARPPLAGQPAAAVGSDHRGIIDHPGRRRHTPAAA